MAKAKTKTASAPVGFSVFDADVLLERAKAIAELVRYKLEGDNFFGEFDRVVDSGRVRGKIITPRPTVDDDVASTALYAVWDLIGEAQGIISDDEQEA